MPARKGTRAVEHPGALESKAVPPLLSKAIATQFRLLIDTRSQKWIAARVGIDPATLNRVLLRKEHLHHWEHLERLCSIVTEIAKDLGQDRVFEPAECFQSTEIRIDLLKLLIWDNLESFVDWMFANHRERVPDLRKAIDRAQDSTHTARPSEFVKSLIGVSSQQLRANRPTAMYTVMVVIPVGVIAAVIGIVVGGALGRNQSNRAACPEQPIPLDAGTESDASHNPSRAPLPQRFFPLNEEVSASSFADHQRPRGAFDKTDETAWCSHLDIRNKGRGEWVEARLPPHCFLDHVKVLEGWRKVQANTATDIELSYEGGRQRVQFPEIHDPNLSQTIHIGATTNYLRLTVKEISGNRVHMICFDGIELYGWCE